MLLQEAFFYEETFLFELFFVIYDLPWAGCEEAIVARDSALWRGFDNLCRDSLAVAFLVFGNFEFD